VRGCVAVTADHFIVTDPGALDYDAAIARELKGSDSRRLAAAKRKALSRSKPLSRNPC
jgi:hypothetical protein